MFRIQYQVVLSGFDGGRLDFFDRLGGDSRGLPEKIRVAHQVVARTQVGGVETTRGKAAFMDRRRLKVPMHREQIEGNQRAFR